MGLERRHTGPGFRAAPAAERLEMERVKRMRILTVEDEESTADAIRMLLENKLEAAVDTVPDCASARELLSSNSYDLITMDYQPLPDGDGLSLLEEIMKMPGAPPVIIVTGRGDEQTAVSAFKLGASGYVVKDESMSTLLVEEARLALAGAELKSAEKELVELSNRLKQTLYTVNDGILTLDSDRIVTSCNKAATEIFGYSEVELLGHSVRKLYRSDEYFHEVGERIYPALREREFHGRD